MTRLALAALAGLSTTAISLNQVLPASVTWKMTLQPWNCFSSPRRHLCLCITTSDQPQRISATTSTTYSISSLKVLQFLLVDRRHKTSPSDKKVILFWQSHTILWLRNCSLISPHLKSTSKDECSCPCFHFLHDTVRINERRKSCIGFELRFHLQRPTWRPLNLRWKKIVCRRAYFNVGEKKSTTMENSFHPSWPTVTAQSSKCTKHILNHVSNLFLGCLSCLWILSYRSLFSIFDAISFFRQIIFRQNNSVAGRRMYSQDIVNKINNKPVWLSDISTYPVIGVCVAACTLAGGYIGYKTTTDDVQFSANKRGTVIRWWGTSQSPKEIVNSFTK